MTLFSLRRSVGTSISFDSQALCWDRYTLAALLQRVVVFAILGVFVGFGASLGVGCLTNVDTLVGVDPLIDLDDPVIVSI